MLGKFGIDAKFITTDVAANMGLAAKKSWNCTDKMHAAWLKFR